MKTFSELNNNIEDLENSLLSVFNRTKITADGKVAEIRYLVENINNLKIEIRPKEHAPPHFHVISGKINASFSIVECNLLKGKIKNKDIKKIKYWHQMNRQKLIPKWNDLRPDDCPVGKIII